MLCDCAARSVCSESLFLRSRSSVGAALCQHVPWCVHRPLYLRCPMITCMPFKCSRPKAHKTTSMARNWGLNYINRSLQAVRVMCMGATIALASVVDSHRFTCWVSHGTLAAAGYTMYDPLAMLLVVSVGLKQSNTLSSPETDFKNHMAAPSIDVHRTNAAYKTHALSAKEWLAPCFVKGASYYCQLAVPPADVVPGSLSKAAVSCPLLLCNWRQHWSQV